MRLKYGYLLKNFTESNTIPVFGPNPSKYVPRDEMAQCLFVCRDRMLNSA